jgi:hypothetical protein
MLVMATLFFPANAADPQRLRSAGKPAVTNLCLNADTSPDCHAALVAALQSIDAPPDVVVTAIRDASTAHRHHGMQPLRFQKRAPWVRRLETLGKEGLPFVRVPRGPESELVVGINRKGVLGFEIKQVSNR